MSNPKVTSQINGDGVYLSISDLQINTSKVYVTITTVPTAGTNSSGDGLTNYIEYIPTVTDGSNNTANFQVPINNLKDDTLYTININGKTSDNGSIVNNFVTSTFEYTDPPVANDINFTVGSGDQSVIVKMNSIASNVETVKFYITEMNSHYKPCVIELAFSDIYGKTVVIDGSSATVNGTLVGTNEFASFIFENGTGDNTRESVQLAELEVAIIPGNDTGYSADYTTVTVIPNADANKPSKFNAIYGTDISGISVSLDEKFVVLFDKGIQVAELPDTSYVIHVFENEGSNNYYYKQFDLSEFTKKSVTHESVDYAYNMVIGNSDGWTFNASNTTGIGGVNSLTLIDGKEYKVSMAARNANENTDTHIDGTSDDDNGYSEFTPPLIVIPSGYPETPVFTLETGGESLNQAIKLTIDGDISDTMLDNGSDIFAYLVKIDNNAVQTFNYDGSFNDNSITITTSNGSTPLVNGVDYTISVRGQNSNGISDASNASATPTTIPSTLTFNVANTLPDINEISALGSGGIKLTWNDISNNIIANSDTTGNGGLPTTNNGTPADITYQYQVSERQSFSGTLLADLSDTDLLTYTTINATNGTSYYARVRAVNANGNGEWSYYENDATVAQTTETSATELVASFPPDMSASAINTNLLNTFMTNQCKVASGIVSLDFTNIIGKNGLTEIDYTGGYDITGVMFVIDNGSGTLVTSPVLPITSSGSKVVNFNTQVPPTGNNTCHMYLLNNVYTVDSFSSYTETSVDASMQITDTLATTSSSSSTSQEDGKVTFQFNEAVVTNATTISTSFKVQLQERYPVQSLSGGAIVYTSTWSDVYNKINQISSNNNTDAYSTTFTGLVNGNLYRIVVTTQSKQPLIVDSLQPNLVSVGPSDPVNTSYGSGTDGAMPYGKPSISVTKINSSHVTVQAQANGRILQDGYMLYGGTTGDNATDYTDNLLIFSASDNAVNGGTFNETINGSSFPAFNSYTNNSEVSTDFHYIADNLETGTDADNIPRYLTIVSGQKGHFTIAKTDNVF